MRSTSTTNPIYPRQGLNLQPLAPEGFALQNPPSLASKARGRRRGLDAHKPNRYEIRVAACAILLERANGTILETLVDTEDLPKILAFKHRWHAHFDPKHQAWRARSSFHSDGRQHQVQLPRFILGLDDPKLEADHLNHDTLDNRKKNLRAVKKSANQLNRVGPLTSNIAGERGVRRDNRMKFKPWRARIRVNRKLEHLGYFATKEEAAAAYTHRALEVGGIIHG